MLYSLWEVQRGGGGPSSECMQQSLSTGDKGLQIWVQTRSLLFAGWATWVERCDHTPHSRFLGSVGEGAQLIECLLSVHTHNSD